MTESSGEVNKTLFVRLLVEFMKDEGIVIEKDFTFHKSNKAFYEFYRNLKAFEMSVVMAGGKLAIPGIGKQDVILNKAGKPFLRYRYSERMQDFLRANIDEVDMAGSYIHIVDGVKSIDRESLRDKTFKFFGQFRDSRTVGTGVDDSISSSEFIK